MIKESVKQSHNNADVSFLPLILFCIVHKIKSKNDILCLGLNMAVEVKSVFPWFLYALFN